MKTATQNLEDDHVHILRLTGIMEQVTYEKEPDVTHLEDIVEIIRNFVDGIHHAKEEDVFFPLLSERGFSSDGGPIAVMLHEHTMGRDFVKAMAESISLYKNGDRNALKKVYDNMRGYAELLRSHISKENNVLFPMAKGVLSEGDQNDLLSEFGKTESAKNPISEYIDKIDNLAVFYEK